MPEAEWVGQTRAALEALAEHTKGLKGSKAAALAAVAARRRDPLGKFLRSKPAKRYHQEGREVIKVSMPLALAEIIYAEAADMKIAGSRMIAVLAALGLPVFNDLRDKFLTGQYDELVIPELIRAILNNAVNPVIPRSQKSRAAWQERVEAALAASQPKKKTPIDPTAAVLAGLGGGKHK